MARVHGRLNVMVAVVEEEYWIPQSYSFICIEF